ncbi:beta-ketoacyl synthase chain length factor [Vibrio sp. WXL103]|uniref:beta-ketoacyl synthase chain length factor n=1 Tax=unclassified Vibrio TaxID=2614977 RepID=UPI003EC5F497
MGINIEVCLSASAGDHFSSNDNIAVADSAPSVPKSFLRRSSPLTKQVLAFSDFVFSSVPSFLIFATRHGELARTMSLLHSIAEQSELSPTQFAQSVHSTAPGILTIANKEPVPFTTICAGQQTLVMALVEAVSYIRNHPDSEVCVIFADERVPDELTSFVGDGCEYSLAIKLRAGDAYTVDVVAAQDEQGDVTNSDNLDHMLEQITNSAAFELRSTSINLKWSLATDDNATS